jgi:hypothetical protein
MHLQSIFHADGWLLTRYDPSHLYSGDEGELYDMRNDPLQLHNLWDDPKHRQRRADLLAQMAESTPPPMDPLLPRLAPV